VTAMMASVRIMSILFEGMVNGKFHK